MPSCARIVFPGAARIQQASSIKDWISCPWLTWKMIEMGCPWSDRIRQSPPACSTRRETIHSWAEADRRSNARTAASHAARPRRICRPQQPSTVLPDKNVGAACTTARSHHPPTGRRFDRPTTTPLIRPADHDAAEEHRAHPRLAWPAIRPLLATAAVHQFKFQTAHAGSS